jgi:type II secretory pathway predicted ATPase ExeA
MTLKVREDSLVFTHLGLHENPWTSTAIEPAAIYRAAHVQSILNSLSYHVAGRLGCAIIHGPEGVGKTTLGRAIVEAAAAQGHAIAMISLMPDSARPTHYRYCSAIAEQLGLQHKRDELSVQRALRDFALQQNRSGKTVMVLYDDAQYMVPTAIDVVLTLHNMLASGGDEFLFQNLLVGTSPQIFAPLKSGKAGARALHSRIVSVGELKPLSVEEAKEFLHARVRAFGGSHLFINDDVIAEIHRISGGIPAQLCRYANEACLSASARNRVFENVTYDDVSLN